MGNYKENMEFVKNFLDGGDWRYDVQDYGHVAVFTGGIGGFKGMYSSFSFILFAGDDELQNYVMFPASADGKQREMAEFIARANYGLKYGDFEMNWDDGAVRFHLTFPMTAVRADEMILPTLLLAPPKMLDQYARGFAEVLMGLKTPAEAIKDCEGD